MKNIVVVGGSLALLLSVGAVGCAGIPDDITAVEDFRVKRFLGTWYEIARLDHSFERGLSNVTATYTMRDDGGIDVVNRGYETSSGEWKQAEGTAYFVEGPKLGRLKVSFFWPFYGGYNVIALDKENYSYSLVCGNNRSYLWMLARDREPEQSVLKKLLDFAQKQGFPVNELIFVEHDKKPPTAE